MAPSVSNTNCKDCPIVKNWLQHKNHICPNTCAECSKTRGNLKLLRKKGKESILEHWSFCKANRSRGIPCCAATTTAGRVKLIKSSHHLPDFGQSYRWLVCRRSNGKCNIEDSRKSKNKESRERYELENSKLLYSVSRSSGFWDRWASQTSKYF